ncbi:MAG: gliding motility-associated protein GldE [Saprospiraceae bacterium]
MDTEPPSSPIGYIFFTSILLFSSGMAFSFIFLLLLIILSALISGSEIAFFSLDSKDIIALNKEDSKSASRILSLKKNPNKLLSTILIGNNFVNIAIVVVSNYLLLKSLGQTRLQKMGQWFFDNGFSWIGNVDTLSMLVNLLITVVGVTSILVLFGEIAPKIYANLNNLKFARLMSGPLSFLSILFSPLSNTLVKWSNKLETKIKNSSSYQSSTTKEDIDTAIDLTVANDKNAKEAKDILKSIVKFGEVSASQIMRSRVDVVAIEITDKFDEVMRIVKESGYSRIPIFENDFDTLIGILYVKDLLGHSDKEKDFNWGALVRKSILYVPGSKKIDDLLREFQLKHTHIAVVVDEYGGSEGIVTLEDVMEEVLGDIKDEFDDDDNVDFIKLSEGNYIFEGKSLLNDVCRAIDVDTNYFDNIKGEADSLAGLIIEIQGVIPKKNTEIKYRELSLKIVSVSKRRIEKINLRILN